uniref:G_PROTEIN_RECEP_F3_4 domain-containing protein n=1 Tax=Heligmosomoides polygyrus TaxID=6339 RepID=A0A8L8KVC0_HELPZ
LSNISTLAIPWKSRFVTEVMKPLDEYTRSLVERMGRLVSVTGTVFDHNSDGIADAETDSSPSHVYRVLIACMGVWSSDGGSCMQPTDTMVLAFILPHVDGDINCLTKHDLLLDYTARLLDVELISGLQFRFPRLSHEQNLRLKTHIKTRLWYEDAHTPLVIISLNGFTKPLLEHRMDTLNKVAECGVTSESVIPCFPSETFTNKLAIATGLYPESQQFGRPDYYVTSNSSTSLREQLDQVVSWLGMPADSRPGLVMVSNDDMIVALQKQASKAELAGVTLQLDRDLNHFFTQLHQDGILRCVNVVFVSDRVYGNNIVTTHFVRLPSSCTKLTPFERGDAYEEIFQMKVGSAVQRTVLEVSQEDAPPRPLAFHPNLIVYKDDTFFSWGITGVGIIVSERFREASRAIKDGYCCHGGFGYGSCNVDGERIPEYAESHDLTTVNMKSRKRDSHLISFYSGNTETQIDFDLVSNRDQGLVTYAKVVPYGRHATSTADLHYEDRSSEH